MTTEPTTVTRLTQAEVIERLTAEVMRRDDPVPLLSLIDLLDPESFAAGRAAVLGEDSRAVERVSHDDWPGGISDGLTLPCPDCGRVPEFGFHVADAFWRQRVPGDDHLGVMCLPCLDRRCGGVGLAVALEEIQWTGTGHTVVLRPTRRVEYEPPSPILPKPNQRRGLMSEPRTEAGQWLIDHQGLVNISQPADRSMRGDEIDLRASVAAIEAEAARLAVEGVARKVEAMTAYHPHEAPYVGGNASLPCYPSQCAGGMRRAVLDLLSSTPASEDGS